MSKTSPSGAATTALTQEVQSPAYLLRIGRNDGVVVALTDHDAPLPFNDGLGLQTYVPDDGMTDSAISSMFDAQVDELDMTAFIGSGSIDYDDIIAGRYDAAEIRLYLVNWDQLAAGAWKMRRGNIGNIDFDEGGAKFQLLGMIQHLVSRTITELTSAPCRIKTFGDGNLSFPQCKIDLIGTLWSASLVVATRLPGSAGQLAGTEEQIIRPSSFNDRWFEPQVGGTTGGTEPAWNTTLGGTTSDGTVTWKTIRARRTEGVTINTIINHMQFTVAGYSGDAPNNFFQSGFVIFNAGENINLKKSIASWDLATKTVTLFSSLNLPALASESVTLVAGCDRTMARCVEFDNFKNYRGEPYLRGEDSFRQTPDAVAA